MGTDLNERIRMRAYEIWTNEGCADGDHQRHWDQAADEIMGGDEHETLQELIDLSDEEEAPRQRAKESTKRL